MKRIQEIDIPQRLAFLDGRNIELCHSDDREGVFDHFTKKSYKRLKKLYNQMLLKFLML